MSHKSVYTIIAVVLLLYGVVQIILDKPGCEYAIVIGFIFPILVMMYEHNFPKNIATWMRRPAKQPKSTLTHKKIYTNLALLMLFVGVYQMFFNKLGLAKIIGIHFPLRDDAIIIGIIVPFIVMVYEHDIPKGFANWVKRGSMRAE